MKSLCFEKEGRRKKTTEPSSFKKQANCEIIEKVCQSRAGAQQELQDSQALLRSSTEPWRAAQGAAQEIKDLGKGIKEDRREKEQENLFFSLSLCSVFHFYLLLYLRLKKTILLHFVQPHSKTLGH